MDTNRDTFMAKGFGPESDRIEVVEKVTRDEGKAAEL
jgi:hypothetical protein